VCFGHPLADIVTTAYYNTDPNGGIKQLATDLDAFESGTKPIGCSNVNLAVQTSQIKSLGGPVKYPASTVLVTPACSQLLQYEADGSAYTALAPYSCSTRQFKVKAS
jgi:hypothetical protein